MLKTQKIVYFITSSDMGGAQMHVLQLCTHLPANYEAVVIAGGKDRLFEKLEQAGIRHYSLSALVNSFSLKETWRAFQQLWSAIRTEKPDFIHAHSAKAGAMARIVGTLQGVPVVYTVHGFGFKPIVPWVKRQVLFLIEFFLAPFTRAMICVANSEATMAKRLPIAANKVHIIHNGMPDTLFRSQVELSPAQSVMVARFAAPKRQDLLLEAFETMPKQGEILNMVGYGKAMDGLKTRYQSASIHFLGEIDTIAALLAEHQIFVLTSDHEGLPLSIIEAMRAGMAIIATDLPGIRELITHDVHGLLVPTAKIEPLREALQKLCSDTALRKRLGQSARARYESEFEINIMMQRLLKVYQSL